MIREFTGRHMLGTMVAMFSVIIGVNLVMATYAVRTFGGLVVDNSYVANQHFNRWLAEARHQARLGWKQELSVDAARRATISLAGPAGPIAGARVSAVATHPLGRKPAHDIRFSDQGNGHYVSVGPVRPGRWLLLIRVERGGEVAMFQDELPA